VDQGALITALMNGTIKGAGLDVMTPEPLPKDSNLLKCKNLVLLPHMGSATEAARRGMAKLSVDNLLLALKGENMLAKISY